MKRHWALKNRDRKPRRMAPEVGFEPTTNRLTADRSTTELLWIVDCVKTGEDTSCPLIFGWQAAIGESRFIRTRKCATWPRDVPLIYSGSPRPPIDGRIFCPPITERQVLFPGQCRAGTTFKA